MTEKTVNLKRFIVRTNGFIVEDEKFVVKGKSPYVKIFERVSEK